MIQFKDNHTEDLNKEDFETDYGIAGKTWRRKPDEGDKVVFDAGYYTIDPKTCAAGVAPFEVHYDTLNRKISAMFILLDEQA
jgi:hypothetical protein